MIPLVLSSILLLPLLQGPVLQLPSSSGGSRGPIASGISSADSNAIVKTARSAQRSFESFRRTRLPIGYRSNESCDVHIGRYCYWRGDGDGDGDGENQQPPHEETHIAERRDGLITMLDNAAHAVRGDAWIAGQFVRYLVEADRIDDAIKFSENDCQASTRWCNALAGYAAQSGARYAAADSAFTRALAAMDAAERCRWLDISDLLDDELEHRYTPLPCTDREIFARRLFWLGAPLYSVSETDLLTEHLSRLTRAQIAERSASVDGESWADDVRALVLRYGWSRWYSRTEPALGSLAQPTYTGHDVGMPYQFFPCLHAVDHLGHLAANDWTLDERRAQAGYAPAFARTIHDLPHQIASFRRGDSTAVVAAWDARKDTTLLGRPLDAALVVAGDNGERAVVRRTESGTVGRLWTTAKLDSGLASLELLAPKDKRAARARVGIPSRSADSLALSDLLLYAPGADSPNSLEIVRDSVLPSDAITGARAVGVYWELYRAAADAEPARITLTVEQISVGWMQRAAEQLRLADPATTLSIQWDEVPQKTNGIAGRGVRLDLGQLRPGKYRMMLSVGAGTGAPAVATKEIELR